MNFLFGLSIMTATADWTPIRHSVCFRCFLSLLQISGFQCHSRKSVSWPLAVFHHLESKSLPEFELLGRILRRNCHNNSQLVQNRFLFFHHNTHVSAVYFLFHARQTSIGQWHREGQKGRVVTPSSISTQSGRTARARNAHLPQSGEELRFACKRIISLPPPAAYGSMQK